MTRAAAALAALLVTACASAAPAPAPAPTAAPVPPAARGPSLYALDLALVDQDGAPRHLDRFRGHRTLVAMFYTSCPTACPMMIEAIRDVERALPDAARADLRVLLVSFDPERDTPAALRAAAVAHRVDGARWSLAATDAGSVRVLAAALGVRYRSDRGGFVHSTRLTLLDGDGRIAMRSDDLDAARRDLPPAIAAMP